MSNTLSDVAQPCEADHTADSGIELILHPRERDLGGFSVRRLLPTTQRKMVGPWIFFDHMGLADFPAGEGINVRPHPHTCLATVTYLFEGEILHRDSLGNKQTITPGDINLMVAGRGIVHSERERPEITQTAHRLHGLQLWLALPDDKEETEPAFYHHASADIPAVDVAGVPVRVMMGSAYGVTSPVQQFSPTLYVEADLQRGQTLELPQSRERAIYTASGSLVIEDTEVAEHAMAILQPGQAVIEARENTRIALIGGDPIGQRYIEWNFVASSKERIAQAKQDWTTGRFPKVPGDEKEFIPLPRQ